MASLRVLHQARDGVFRLYAGDLEVTANGVSHRIAGDVELDLLPRTRLTARFAGDQQWLTDAAFAAANVEVVIPADADLNPPVRSAVVDQPEGKSWATLNPSVNRLTAGDLSACKSFIMYTSGDIARYPFPTEPATPDGQRILIFTLPGWEIRVAAVEGAPVDGTAFTAVIEAVPAGNAPTLDDAGKLLRRLFLIISFVCGRETIVGPMFGLSGDGSVKWVDLGAPRDRARAVSPTRWCARSRIPEGITAIAEGFSRIAGTTMEPVIDRSINYLLATGGAEVLDLRVPMACAGLELLGWSVLQEEGWATSETVSSMTAPVRLRLLLQWAGIPVALPSEFTALAAKRGRIGQSAQAFQGPELVVKIRNELVHPPKRLSALEWPKPDEMLECWQLATWYLELTILRLLQFGGDYQSRLKLNGWEGAVEPVPWAK